MLQALINSLTCGLSTLWTETNPQPLHPAQSFLRMYCYCMHHADWLTFHRDSNGENLVVIPEKIYIASIFIGIAAALIDFLDGFVARLLKALPKWANNSIRLPIR
jgi:phosphatidylglycerophosphate synthase